MENPFSLSPSPRYCYLTALHRATVAKTEYVINNRQGLTTVIADVGHGKTTVLRFIYDRLRDRDDVTAKLMVNPQFKSEMAFLKAICLEFGIEPRRSKLEQISELNSFLLGEYKAGRNVVLAIDESQLLVGPQFELIRQLLNFETNEAKLITIVMAGQPELKGKLKLKKALASRIAVNSTIDALPPDDTREMIRFRLKVAGYPETIFPDDTCAAIYDRTRGIPREIVKTCAVALQLAQLNHMEIIPAELIEAAREQVALAQ